MVYSQALADRAAAWLARPLDNTAASRRSNEGLLELATVWAATQGVPLPGCLRQCQYSDRVHDLNAYLRDYARFTSPSSVMATADTPQATYQFKPEYAGQTLTADDYGKAVTADNLTDEDAEHFIEKGFGHVLQKIGAAVEAVGEKLEGVGDGLAKDDYIEVTPTNPLVTEADLQAEQTAHTATKQELAAEVRAYEEMKVSYNESTAALASEKQAHEETKSQLSEVQQQLVAAQRQLADATAPKAKKPAAAPVAPAMTASTTPASDATKADTDGTKADGSTAS